MCIISYSSKHVLLFSCQHVCRACTGRAAWSAAAVLRARPATTSLESAVVLLDSWETAANRVSNIYLHCFSARLDNAHVNPLPPSLPQLVFQVPLGRTVTRSASAPRQTNSAILCLDRVTALQVFTAPDVTKVCKKNKQFIYTS